MGRASQRDAADDHELERIMSMTEDELIESMGGRVEYERAAQEAREIFERAVAEAELRTGRTFNPEMKRKMSKR